MKSFQPANKNAPRVYYYVSSSRHVVVIASFKELPSACRLSLLDWTLAALTICQTWPAGSVVLNVKWPFPTTFPHIHHKSGQVSGQI